MGQAIEKNELFTFEPVPQVRSLNQLLASDLRSQGTKGRFGCLIDLPASQTADPYLIELIAALKHQLDRQNCSLAFIEQWSDLVQTDRVDKVLNPDLIDVLVLLHCEHRLESVKKFLNKVIVIGAFLSDYQVDYLTFDLVDSARSATDYLLNLSHRRILFLGPAIPDQHVWRERQTGYKLALMNHPTHPAPRILTLDSCSWQAILQVARTVLTASDRPSAIFAHNDLIALAVLKTAHELGLHVPRDLSVIGFNDDDFSKNTHPALTTVQVDKHALSRLVVQWGLTRIENPDVPPQITLIPGRLIVRESCAPLLHGSERK